MLTISDLTADCTLEKDALSGIRGGFAPGELTEAFVGFGYFNSPTMDLGMHGLVQSQAMGIDQSGAAGGFSMSGVNQTQNGVSGQVAI